MEKRLKLLSRTSMGIIIDNKMTFEQNTDMQKSAMSFLSEKAS